jgi:trk system potassium uptake protein TrkA
MAYRLDLKGVVDSHKVTDRYQLIEVEVPKLFIGSKVSQIDFIDEYKVKLVTIIRPSLEKNVLGTEHEVRESLGMVNPETVLKEGDSLLLFGEVKKLEGFIEY